METTAGALRFPLHLCVRQTGKGCFEPCLLIRKSAHFILFGRHPLDGEAEFAALGVVLPRSDDRALVGLDHAMGGFGLPALAVGAAMEAVGHEATIVG